MFINQSLLKNKALINGKRYKYMNGYLSRDLLYQKIRPLRDAAFGADCLTSLSILKIITIGLKNGLWYCYEELLHVAKIFRF